MVAGEHTLIMSALQLLRFGIDSVLKSLNERMTQIMTDSINKIGSSENDGRFDVLIIQNVRSFLTAVTPTAVKPTAVILLELT